MPAQETAARKLSGAGRGCWRKSAAFPCSAARPTPPQGLYIWGDVGRGKTMLMDLFFEEAPVEPRSAAPISTAFMVDVHARIHAERQRAGSSDPIPVGGHAPWPRRRGCCASTNSRSPTWPTP